MKTIKMISFKRIPVNSLILSQENSTICHWLLSYVKVNGKWHFYVDSYYSGHNAVVKATGVDFTFPHEIVHL